MEGRVTEVIEKSPKKDYPIIITFQNGALLKRKKGTKRNIEVTKDDTGSKQIKITSNENHEYVGTEEPPGLFRTFLVVKKARTGEVKMQEVGTANLKNAMLKTTREIVIPGDDYLSRSAVLNKTFGGKKAVRKMERSEKLRLNMSTNQSTLLSSIKEIEIKEAPDSISQQLDSSLTSLLPPCHRKAEDAGQVYVLSELFGKDVFDAMEDIAVDAINSAENLHAYTKALLEARAEVKLTAEEATATLLVDAIVHFIKLKSNDLKRRFLMISQHEPIHRKIVELFCQHTGKFLSRSLSMRDKAVAYCMATGFCIDPKRVIPLNQLSQDTSISYRKLTTICRAVGGVPKEKGSHCFVLKLPLPSLPTTSFSRKSTSNSSKNK